MDHFHFYLDSLDENDPFSVLHFVSVNFRDKHQEAFDFLFAFFVFLFLSQLILFLG